MKIILETQLKCLKELIFLLESEKKILIRLKGNELFRSIEAKREVVERIEELEESRKIKYDDTEFRSFLKNDHVGRKLLRAIEIAMNEVREIQKTNLMLTSQSIVYNNNLIEMIQSSIAKGPATYARKGYVQKTSISVQGAFDESV